MANNREYSEGTNAVCTLYVQVYVVDKSQGRLWFDERNRLSNKKKKVGQHRTRLHGPVKRV